MGSPINIHTKVVGVTRRNAEGDSIQELLEDMSVCACSGDALELEHDLENQYDDNAIRVFWECNHIGYLSRDLAAEFVSAVDAGCVQAKLAEITGGGDKSYGCNIVLEVFDSPVTYTPQPRKKIDIPEDLLEAAKNYVANKKTVGVADIQRGLKVGYTQAAALIDKLEELGYVGPFIGAQPRKVLISSPKTTHQAMSRLDTGGGVTVDDQVSTATSEITKLKSKVALFPVFIGFAALFGIMGLAAFVVAHEILLGLCCIIGAGIAGLIALKGSDAADSLEEMGLRDIAQKAKKTGARLTVAVLGVVVLLAGAGYYISHQIDIQREKDAAEDWDRLAVATATVALDQYAPGTDYGPMDATGWTVIHNNDGITTVWAPQVYGRIAVMLTDDGENYAPYYISVDGAVMLDQ